MLHRGLMLGVWAVVSRLLGLVRDLLMAWLVGSGSIADALVAATLIPHALRKLLADGVLSLPFTAAIAGKRVGKIHFFSCPIAGMFTFPFLGSAIFLFFLILATAPFLVYLLGAGCAQPGWIAEASGLLRLASPYIPAALCAAVAMGLLHSLGCFGPAAASSLLFNLTILSFLAAASFGIGAPASMMATGFAAGGLVQVLWLFFFLSKAVLSPRSPGRAVQLQQSISGRFFSFPDSERLFASSLRKGFVLLPGSVLGASTLPLCLAAAMYTASLTGEGMMTALYFADRLLELPIGVVGACLSMASLPELSSFVAQGRKVFFAARLRQVLHFGLVFSLPACFGLLAVTPRLTSMLLGHGSFKASGLAATVLCLFCLIPALPACIMNRTLIAAVQTLGAPRVAWLSAVVCSVFSLVSGIAWIHLFPNFAAMSGPCSACLGLWLQAVLLVAFLFRSGTLSISAPLSGCENWFAPAAVLRLLVCGLLAGSTAWIVLYLMPQASDMLALGLACFFGALGWLGALRLLRPGDFILVFSRRQRSLVK